MQKTNIILFLVCISFAVMALALIIGVNIFGWREKQKAAPYATYEGLLNIAIHGCEKYKADYGSWPTSLVQVQNFNGTLVNESKDMWGNDVVFIPYSESLGYGEIISYGRNGKSDAPFSNRWLIARYPVKDNYSWNKRQARAAAIFKGGWWATYDWFDSYINTAYWPETNGLSTNADWGKP